MPSPTLPTVTSRSAAAARRPPRWKVAELQAQARDLAARLRVSPVLGQILVNRGITEDADCRSFLSPSLRDLHPPEMLPGLTAAAERVARAVRDGVPIAIYGDYDVDGITATSILFHALTTLGATVRTYVPHRIDEGYGLTPRRSASCVMRAPA